MNSNYHYRMTSYQIFIYVYNKTSIFLTHHIRCDVYSVLVHLFFYVIFPQQFVPDARAIIMVLMLRSLDMKDFM